MRAQATMRLQRMKVATASWTSWVCLEELQSSIEGKATHEELVGKEATGACLSRVVNEI